MPKLNKNPGILYIVATPLGNRQDITLRAIETLKNVDFIAAEDTRHSLPLLQNYSISRPLISLHEHNERERVELLLKELANGHSIALITDAGTPLISDPGYHLVQKTRAAGVTIVPVPGPCAAIAALSASGLPTDRFVFEGFLPAKSKSRLEHLAQLKNESRTMIFYESPHRILDSLQDLVATFGDDREAVIARELTKMFETIHKAPLKELLEWVGKDANQQRGEMVLLVAGSTEVNETVASDVILIELLKHLSLKEAVAVTAKITGEKKNLLYERALKIKK